MELGIMRFLASYAVSWKDLAMDASTVRVSHFHIFLIRLQTLASKILMNIFPEKKLARMNGILQTFTGLGMLSGPIMGSILFTMGGFQLPFYTVGVLLLALASLIIYILPSEVQQQRTSLANTPAQRAQANRNFLIESEPFLDSNDTDQI